MLELLHQLTSRSRSSKLHPRYLASPVPFGTQPGIPATPPQSQWFHLGTHMPLQETRPNTQPELDFVTEPQLVLPPCGTKKGRREPCLWSISCGQQLKLTGSDDIIQPPTLGAICLLTSGNALGELYASLHQPSGHPKKWIFITAVCPKSDHCLTRCLWV